MRRVESIKQTTQNKFLNMYELDMKSDTGKHSTYFVASRAKTIEELKIKTRENKADGVIIYVLWMIISMSFQRDLWMKGKTLRWLA